jgi:hypothetical protein
MAEKTTKLSIIVRTVDQATAKIRAINSRISAITKPFRDFKSALGDFKEKSGLSAVIGRVPRHRQRSHEGLLSKIALIGGVAVAVGYGVMSLIDKFDELGDKAERLGVGVDFLAQMRYAAERSGAPSRRSTKACRRSRRASARRARAPAAWPRSSKLVSPAL